MAGRKKHTTKGPVSYQRPEILIRTRKGKPKVEYDADLANQILSESIDRAGFAKSSPKGRCYVCDKKIPPMRKLCAKCLANREEERLR